MAIFELKKSVFTEMPNKVSKEIAKDVEEQKSKSKAFAPNEQGTYVDSSRKDLSKTLKNFETEESIRLLLEKCINCYYLHTCIYYDGICDSESVNSGMYQREARHFSSKKLYEAANKNLTLGRR